MPNTLTQIASNTTLAITELQNFVSSAVSVAVTVTPTAGDLVVWASATTLGDLPQVGTTNIANSAVTYAKIQNEATVTLLGNPTGSPAAPSEITLGTGLSFAGSVLNVAGGMTYLGTVGTVSNAIADTTILAANNSSYRSFKLILKNIIPGTNSVGMSLQVHSGGTFQTTTYQSQALSGSGLTPATAANGTQIPFSAGGGSFANAAPGVSGEIEVANLADTSQPKMWHGRIAGNNGTATGALITVIGGYWNGGNGAVDGFQIIATSGNLTSGNVDIYGQL